MKCTDRPCRHLRPRPPRYIVESREEIQVLACGEPREERPLRGNGEPDSRPHRARIRCGIEPFYQDPAAIGQQHGGDELERGRLAAAVWAEQDQNASRGNFERDVIESNRLARALTAEPIEKRRAMAKDFADGFEYDRRHVEQRRPELPVERQAFPPAWTRETPVPPQPGLRKSLYYSGRREPGIEKLEVAGESATSSQRVRYERCLSNSELLKFSIPQLLSDQFARVLVSS